ncbi:conserved hypothetical protein [Bacillus sp. 349Y]|nr:conserved hypothetical protein [Bacillus sp. 349Y]
MNRSELSNKLRTLIEKIKEAFRKIVKALYEYVREFIKPAIIWFDEIAEAREEYIQASLSRAAERATWSNDVPHLRSQVAYRKPTVLRARTNC